MTKKAKYPIFYEECKRKLEELHLMTLKLIFSQIQNQYRWTWWHTPAIPTSKEAKAGGLLVQTQPEQLKNLVRDCLKIQGGKG